MCDLDSHKILEATIVIHRGFYELMYLELSETQTRHSWHWLLQNTSSFELFSYIQLNCYELSIHVWPLHSTGFPGGSAGKVFACSVGDLGSIPGLWRSGEGKGYLLHHSGLKNSMDKGVWQATVHGIAKVSDMTEQLSLTYIWENQFMLHLKIQTPNYFCVWSLISNYWKI